MGIHFPFTGSVLLMNIKIISSYLCGINIEPNNANVLANFSISEMKVPLLLLSEKGPLRFAVWTSPDLNQLRFKIKIRNLIIF